ALERRQQLGVVVPRCPLHADLDLVVGGGVAPHRLLDAVLAVLVVPVGQAAATAAAPGVGAAGRRHRRGRRHPGHLEEPPPRVRRTGPVLTSHRRAPRSPVVVSRASGRRPRAVFPESAGTGGRGADRGPGPPFRQIPYTFGVNSVILA